ncbi:hypothetical protein SERLA73DRAFT_64115 [Serpula lacrymans var. lacrymans S7.3]|uniref:Uncharacterized protein n=1 Tax=Serpula lacrymans var. lacrymans (strain S7.3) TaxID=936435 RepID=F8QDY4_SERL3|nr:hypothetical protein SERLA73DRAFT_64115 [Serpula lacrymans var. lacrymans S7.3]
MSKPRLTRSQASSSPRKPSLTSAKQKRKLHETRDINEEPETSQESDAHVSSGALEFEDISDEDDVKSLHSDALDNESDSDLKKARTLKRKRGSLPKQKETSKRTTHKISSKKKKTKTKTTSSDEDEGRGTSNEEESGLKDGQEIVGVVVRAPKSGWVPEGQISQNTLDFLTQLKDPVCNDRECSYPFLHSFLSDFNSSEPVYRRAEKEWKAFIDAFTEVLIQVDPQIPPLPPKDVTHRIYRDVRFSNDKTPYKKGFSASFSRSGRKGIFACCRCPSFKPGDESLLAAGSWCPGKNELSTIRNHILHSSARLREILAEPAFVELFGKASPLPNGGRQSIFGMEDELKVAPKGIDKNHKDIDLLKCRTFAVSYKFTDKQVLAPDFKEEVGRIASVVQPFVHCLNDMMTLPVSDSSDGEEDRDNSDDEAL